MPRGRRHDLKNLLQGGIGMSVWDGHRGWLGALDAGITDRDMTTEEIARAEAESCFGKDRVILEENDALGEGYRILAEGDGYRVRGGKTGLLYGVYRLIRHRLGGEMLPEGDEKPRYGLRMIDCWDNMDGTVERGYSGRSIWFEGGRLTYRPERIRMLGRLLASVGINCLCINNVNVHEPAQGLIDEMLPDLKAMADLLRPYGVRLMVSVDFAMPLRCGMSTADPLDGEVAAWWKDRAEKVYAAVPDLAGFLVKADSEHRPGPFTYGRTHADGANMLARALKPFGGSLVWRAFVYNCMQDWRDTRTDRPKAAYETYQPLDGLFDDNVILQVKHGPFDFQVREPLSPLLLSMKHTRLAAEFQLAQEYTGHQIDLYYMPPMWDEVFSAMGTDRTVAVAAVSNLGRDDCWTGNPLALANLFAYGCYAWNPVCGAEETARIFIRMTWGFEKGDEDTLARALTESRGIYEKYCAPLGICWMVSPNGHYGPSPDGYEYQLWGTYHRADRDAVGIDRTSSGTGYLDQYPEEVQRIYRDPETCPDEYLLFFHRRRYDSVMRDGRTLIQRIYDDHFEGADRAEKMAEDLKKLPFPERDRGEIFRRLDLQVRDAAEWRDVINTFFRRLSGAEDERGRKIWR